MGGIPGGSAYTKNLIRCEATPMGSGEVFLLFTEGDRGLFAVTLECGAAHAVAQACAESLADSDWPDLWWMAPNPKTDPDLLEAMGRDPAELRRMIAEARSQLDAIEAAVIKGSCGVVVGSLAAAWRPSDGAQVVA